MVCVFVWLVFSSCITEPGSCYWDCLETFKSVLRPSEGFVHFVQLLLLLLRLTSSRPAAPFSRHMSWPLSSCRAWNLLDWMRLGSVLFSPWAWPVPESTAPWRPLCKNQTAPRLSEAFVVLMSKAMIKKVQFTVMQMCALAHEGARSSRAVLLVIVAKRDVLLWT